MANKRSEIIAAEMMIIPLLFLFVTDVTNLDFRPIEKNSIFYILSTSICTLIYLAIFYLHIKRISTHRCKSIITGTLSLVAIVAIFPMRFIFHPERWDYEFRLLIGIDFVATVVLLLFNFIQDRSNTILVGIFSTVFVLLYIVFADHHQQPYNYIIAVTILTGAYLIIFWLYIKHISNRKWRATITVVFVFGIVIMVLLYCLRISGIKLIFDVLMGFDAFSAFVLWLWMYAPRVKAWQNVYTEQVVYQSDQYDFLQTAGLPSRFTLIDLMKATKNFQTPIGQGGSGAVFKGTIEDGSIIAVKRIKGQPSGEVEFKTEITIIANLQHVNLVHLLGYCLSTRGDRYLIYPYFENGSLDSWIFAQEEKRSKLTWPMRYNIAIAVAKALAYLHNECHHRILHLDVKPANILLDGDFKALVSDFGISKSIGRDETSVMTRARGTVGYLAPEMLMPNAISAKSDVYSYGMVLLELFGGQKNFQTIIDKQTRQRRNTYFPKTVREKMIEGKLMEIVDKSLLKDEDVMEDQVTVLVQVALWCIQENPELRPTTTEVVDMLEGRMAVQIPPECPMFVVNFLDVESGFSVSGESRAYENYQFSNNSISISIMSGR